MKTATYIKLSLILILIIDCTSLSAQINTVGSYKNLITVKESRADLQGSPYLLSDWTAATIKFSPGIEPKTENIKYDLLDDVLIIKGEGDTEYTFTDAPKEFKLSTNNEIYRNGFSPVDKMTEKTFYNVIYDGKVKYLKKLSKMVIESKGYNSATVEKKVADETNFYIAKAGEKPVKVKGNEKSIIAVLGKNEALSKYIKENKLDLKSTEGISKLLTYYDTL
ncbi:hypothetical protein EZ449_21080 [Pedobacter frigidisoli]|uniref:Uncharacterized protein n=1 Tax=Pedobacter frigidisoli TaxID=2530455 RepID=A0A4R0NHH8_9SPHI|nr:hypothetical protein [Pedobacter frigidisoli]TCD00032.1 hypothetical protein EZ449_21080 [Pedobacter frigidisoli]